MAPDFRSQSRSLTQAPELDGHNQFVVCPCLFQAFARKKLQKRQMTHRFCRSYRAVSPSQLWARGSVRASSTLQLWTGRSDSGEPPSQGFWPPDARQTWRSGRCPVHCQTQGRLSSWWRRWGPGGGRCYPMRHLEVTAVGMKKESNTRCVNNNHGRYVVYIALTLGMITYE